MNANLNLFSLATLIILFISCNDSTQRKSDTESLDKLFKNKIISVEKGVTMYDEHTKKRAEILQPVLKNMYKDPTFVDTKFVYFSLQDMKDYISFLEHIQQQNPDEEVSGVRVYFGAYPEVSKNPDKKIKHPKQQTIFMVPTKNIGKVDTEYKNMNNIPFYVRGTKDNPYKGDFVIIDELMLDYKKKLRLKKASEKTKVQKASLKPNISNLQTIKDRVNTSTIFNEGEMSPPPIKK